MKTMIVQYKITKQKTGKQPNSQKTAVLRTCASCMWIFRGGITCPACGFGSYGARYVFGDKCYRYEETQKPWFDRKLESYRWNLHNEALKIKNKVAKNLAKERCANGEVWLDLS